MSRQAAKCCIPPGAGKAAVLSGRVGLLLAVTLGLPGTPELLCGVQRTQGGQPSQQVPPLPAPARWLLALGHTGRRCTNGITRQAKALAVTT